MSLASYAGLHRLETTHRAYPRARTDCRTVTYTAVQQEVVVSHVTVPTTIVSTVHVTVTAIEAVPTTVVQTQVATQLVTDTQILNQCVASLP